MAAPKTADTAPRAGDAASLGPSAAPLDAAAGDSAHPATPRSEAVYGRRMRLSLLSILSVPVLLAVAPIHLSMPFAVVALAAPLLTACDCRRERDRQPSSEHSAGERRGRPQPVEPQTAETTPADEGRAHTAGRVSGGESAMQPAGSSDGSAGAASRQAQRLDSSELSVVRSEERLVVAKQRLVTSKLVVRKVVTTEMVVMSVPVRRERLEVETVQLDTPILLRDGPDELAAAATGYVAALPSDGAGGDEDAEAGISFSGDRHNYAGVDEAGRSVIALLLCEERPRVEMDLVPVTRVTVTRLPYAFSQLLEADLRKEQIDFVAPHSAAATVLHQHQQRWKAERSSDDCVVGRE